MKHRFATLAALALVTLSVHGTVVPAVGTADATQTVVTTMPSAVVLFGKVMDRY